MKVERNRYECPIRNSELCEYIGCDGCESCVFEDGMSKSSDPDLMMNNWVVTLSHLPRNVDDIHNSEICAICGQKKTECYGELMLAHPEPEYKKGMIFGMGKKVRASIGSLIELPIACCKSCKWKIRLRDILHFGGAVVSLGLGLLVMYVLSLCGVQTNSVLSTLVFLGASGIFWLIFWLIGRAYQKHLQKRIYANPLDIPMVEDLLKRGWFPIPEVKKGRPAKLHFMKNKVRRNFTYFATSIEEEK